MVTERIVFVRDSPRPALCRDEVRHLRRALDLKPIDCLLPRLIGLGDAFVDAVSQRRLRMGPLRGHRAGRAVRGDLPAGLVDGAPAPARTRRGRVVLT
jgi:hypothetical protein